jgi:hypothetical protein
MPWSNGGDFEGIIRLGGRLKPGTSPTAIRWLWEKIKVYFFDDNNHLCYQEGYEAQWSNVVDTNIQVIPPDPNTGIVVSPAAVSIGDKVYIFYRGQNNGLWVTASNDSVNFQPPVDIGGSNLTSDPSAANRDGSIAVFYRGVGGQFPPLMWRTLELGTGWGPERPLGGQLTSSPAAISWGGNRLDVFYRGRNYDLWSRTNDGGGFGGESDRGEQLTSSPAVASFTPGILDVFFRGLNGHTWHKHHLDPLDDWDNHDDRRHFIEEPSSPAAASARSRHYNIAVFYTFGSELYTFYYYE